MQPTFESHSHSMIAGINEQLHVLRGDPSKKARMSRMDMPTLNFPRKLEGGLAIKTEKCSEGTTNSHNSPAGYNED